MATFTWQDIIDRARTYVDDDHDDTKGWIKPERWLRMAFVEYQLQRKKWIRMGLIAPATTDIKFTGPTTSISGVLCTIGVAEVTSGAGYFDPTPTATTFTLRPLTWVQDTLGRAPFLSKTDGRAWGWRATGGGDNLVYTVEPQDTATYIVRYIATVAAPTLASSSIEIPDGADERLVLGLARRAHVKDSTASALLQRLIDEHDAELNFQAMGRVNDSSPRVRSTPRQPYSRLGFTSNPNLYRYH